MSTRSASRHDLQSSASNFPRSNQSPSPTNWAADSTIPAFAPCAATASFVLYAQRNVVLVLHHDTLAIERRCDLHREDVVWVVVDNESERGSGRLAVSYDTGSTAIVWDILTGGEIARFAAYARIRTASFMRNGNITFGNDQGNIILFESSTSEHVSTRTIFDPITAIAPSTDCKTFAIGYANGSILIATLQPSFTILYTLTTSRAPSTILGLSWHGSSSKQKTDMLATQNSEGDLRVWSVPKLPSLEQPCIIRVLQRSETQQPGPCWFAWSKNGRIVQYSEGETRAWDVRTRKVTWEQIPTGDDILGLASFGPSAALFVLSRDHVVRQFDITPNAVPKQVVRVQHIPAKTPPTPPMTLEERKIAGESRSSSVIDRERDLSDAESSSTDEPLQVLSSYGKRANDTDSLDALESEIRDKVTPLSPTSSRASSQSSRSSQTRRMERRYLYDRPGSRASTMTPYQGTDISIYTPVPRLNHDSMSIRSVSSYASNNRLRPSSLRKEVVLSPEDIKEHVEVINLFPAARARSRGNTDPRTPHIGELKRTPEVLQREMLKVVFGWNDTARNLIYDEFERHLPGSEGAFTLAKWLGHDSLETVLSAMSDRRNPRDTKFLLLYTIGPDSPKPLGEVFAQKCLQDGDIHMAVAALIGVAEFNDAVEIYVAQNFWLEAILLTCIHFPSDWQRISRLLQNWGMTAVTQCHTELAIRLLSCMQLREDESRRSDPPDPDIADKPLNDRYEPSKSFADAPMSPPLKSASGRLTAMNASLKLITSFGDRGQPIETTADDKTPMLNNAGVTPIAQSALPFSAMSPAAIQPWINSTARAMREPSSARTMTQSRATSRKRLPSIASIARAKEEAAQLTTPITAAKDSRSGSISHSRKEPSLTALEAPSTAIRNPLSLPSPTEGVFDQYLDRSRSRTSTKSNDKRPEGLAVQVVDNNYASTRSPQETGSQHSFRHGRPGAYSPAFSGASRGSGRVGGIDEYLASVEPVRQSATENGSSSDRRGESKRSSDENQGRGTSRHRERSEVRTRRDTARYLSGGKRSPSSPIPMSPEEIAEAAKASRADTNNSVGERLPEAVSPITSPKGHRSRHSRTTDDIKPAPLTISGRSSSPNDGRGRRTWRQATSEALSPSAPPPEAYQTKPGQVGPNSDEVTVPRRAKSRAGAASRERRAESRSRRERSSSRGVSKDLPVLPTQSDIGTNSLDTQSTYSGTSGTTEDRARRLGLSKKQLAARELEERRLSLARRPSAPPIPMPGETPARPGMMPRANTEQSPLSQFVPALQNATLEKEQPTLFSKTSGSSAPFGLPATPRAMKHPRNFFGEGSDPPVPSMPENASQLSSVVSSYLGYHADESTVSSAVNSSITNLTSNVNSNVSTGFISGDANVAHQPVALAGNLLPSSYYRQRDNKAPPRSSSAPLDDSSYSDSHTVYRNAAASSFRQGSVGMGGHSHKNYPLNETLPHSAYSRVNHNSLDEALAYDENSVIVVPERENPTILPELAHLSDPPPPPPPPLMGLPLGPAIPKIGSGFIDIVIDEDSPSLASNGLSDPVSLPGSDVYYRAGTAPPHNLRIGRVSSISETSSSQSFGSRFRGIGERMRSTSRNRTKSPHFDNQTGSGENIPPPMPSRHRRGDSLNRAKSPYEKAMALQMGSAVSSASESGASQLPNPAASSVVSSAFSAPGYEGIASEVSSAPSSFSGRSMPAAGGSQNAKEVRANRPPETTQHGVYPDIGSFM